MQKSRESFKSGVRFLPCSYTVLPYGLLSPPSVAVLLYFESMFCLLGSGTRVSILYATGQMFKPTYSRWHAHGFFPGFYMSRGIKHEQLRPAALPSYSMDTKKCRTWNLANGCIPGIWMKTLNPSSLYEILEQNNTVGRFCSIPGWNEVWGKWVLISNLK